jgi:serine/threonine-protein phosphatase PGAM5
MFENSRPFCRRAPILATAALFLAACAVATAAPAAPATGPAVAAPASPAAGPAAAAPATPAARTGPTGVRTLYLIRHGQYTFDPVETGPGAGLTPLGREEAGFAAARLKSLPDPIDSLFTSPLTRTRETAGIIHDQGLPWLEPILVPDLAECTPPTWRKEIMAGVTAGEADSCRQQLDRVFARFFRPSPERNVREVLVCHGNVIRYLVCRALGVDTNAWLGMMIAHCSFTEIRILPDGTPRLVSFGDMGHLPPARQTFANVPRAAQAPAR